MWSFNYFLMPDGNMTGFYGRLGRGCQTGGLKYLVQALTVCSRVQTTDMDNVSTRGAKGIGVSRRDVGA